MSRLFNIVPNPSLVFIIAGLCSIASVAFAQDSPTRPTDERGTINNETGVHAGVVTGNTENISLGGSEKLTLHKKRITNILTAGVLYVRDDIFNDAVPAKTSSRNIFVKDKTLWEFHERTHAFLGGGWLTNQTSGVDHQFDGFVGFGYKLLALDRHTLSVEAGYQFEHQNRVTPFADAAATHYATFETDYLWSIAEKTSLDNATEVAYDVNHRDNVRIVSETRLKVDIAKHIALTTEFKLQFDESPVPTFKKLNTTSTTGITVVF